MVFGNIKMIFKLLCSEKPNSFYVLHSFLSCCILYRQLAIIKEDQRNERISNCIAKNRETLVYSSVSNSVQVQILPSGMDNSQILLEYKGENKHREYMKLNSCKPLFDSINPHLLLNLNVQLFFL